MPSKTKSLRVVSERFVSRNFRKYRYRTRLLSQIGVELTSDLPDEGHNCASTRFRTRYRIGRAGTMKYFLSARLVRIFAITT